MTAAAQEHGEAASPQAGPENDQEISGNDTEKVRNCPAKCKENRPASRQKHSCGPQGEASRTGNAPPWPEHVKKEQDDATGKLGNHNAGKQCRCIERHENKGLAIKACSLDRQS